MSIINPITTGGGGAWTAVENTAIESYELTFPVDREPSDWIVFGIIEISSGSSYRENAYIGKAEQSDARRSTWDIWYNTNSSTANINSQQYATGTYNSEAGTFVVSLGYGSSFYTDTGSEYALIYI